MTGVSTTLKRDTSIREIGLTDDPVDIVCKIDRVEGRVRRAEFPAMA